MRRPRLLEVLVHPRRGSNGPKTSRTGRRRTARTARTKAVASIAAVGLLVGGITWAATRSPGFTTEHVEPNDGTVWVTNDRSGLFGRLNTSAASLDAAFAPVDGKAQTYQLDVLQSGGTVLARDRIVGRLAPVDTQTGELVKDRAVSVPSGTVTAVGGGTVVTVDPETGEVRAAFSSKPTLASIDGLSAQTKALGTVALSADLATGGATGTAAVAATVGGDGTAYVIGSGGDLLALHPVAGGKFTVDKTALGAQFQHVQISVRGTRTIVVDTATGAAILPGGPKVTLPPSVRDGVLQGSGPDADAVLLATPTALLSIALADGAVTTLSTAGTGPAAAPIAVDGCRYAAWAGSPGTAVRVCGDGRATAVPLEQASTLLTPMLRLNRRAAVLNDSASGALWDLRTGRRLDNWTAVAPPATTKPPKEQEQKPTLTQSQRPPRAVDDSLGARPGRTSILHVLDNDSNPSGHVLSIKDVGTPQPPTATVAIAPDGQTLQIALAAGARTTAFGYTIDDGKGHTSSATVTVTARAPGDNGKPVLRVGHTPRTQTVANRGHLALPVIADWRDPDSDPVILVGAKDGSTPVGVSTDGRLRYAAPADPGPRKIIYTVSDGRAPTEGTVAVEVLSKTSTVTTPPTTQPDVGRGEVDKPIVVRPIENDLPGTDPSSPSARLELAGEVVAPDGATVVTDVKTGTVTVTAGAPGTYLLAYTARYGDAPYARGTIRIDVAARKDRARAPTAMLDQAVLFGQTPTVVDVLANDFDPSGRLLVVQSAVTDSSAAVEVAVIRGRWVRIKPLRPTLTPNPMRIRYAITNGVGAAVTGDISVQQLPPPKDGTPVPSDDFATVRSGDNVTIPVTDNDIDPAGEALTLATQVEGAPRAGTLPVTGAGTAAEGGGAAYVSGSVVRFQAPTVTAVTTVSVRYVVQDPGGTKASGTAYVTVVPPPATDRPNQAPAPPTLEGRVVAGATTTINIPGSGVDPDGDSVTFVGLGSAPAFGRIMDQSPSSVTYQAYPTSGETDEFRYVVTDRFGRTGTGSIRIAVVPPGDPQPAVAVDDQVVVAPGRTLAVDVLANDIQPIGDTASVLPIAPLNPDLGDRAVLDREHSLLRLTAPPRTDPMAVRYAIRGASGQSSTATVRVRSQEGVTVPPIAHNAYAQPESGATSVEVDVLAGAFDPDDAQGALTVSRIFNAPGATIAGGKVTVRVEALPQVLAFEVLDEDGAATIASIYVPTGGSGAPVVKDNSLITMDKDSSITVGLADVVVSATGRPVGLTTSDRLFASPGGMLRVEGKGRDRLVLTSMKGYVGPAAIVFEVTDGASATDPKGHRALLTVPVQVGPETPVLRCPPAELDVVTGGQSRPLSIPALCHVWTARPGTLAALQFVGTFPGGEAGLTVSNSDNHTLVVSASKEAVPGTRARMLVSIAGTDAPPVPVTVRVAPADPPTVAPIAVTGVKAGTTKTTNIAGYLSSQLGGPDFAIVDLAQVSGPPAEERRDGPTTISITPDPTAKGRITYRVTVSDVGGASGRADRLGSGVMTVDVLGVPDAPGTPFTTGETLSHAVLLSWAVPADNGLPIEKYLVTWPGGELTCTAMPCLISGLDNGQGLRFTVRAVNAVGEGPPSQPSAPITPDTVPQAPGNPRAVVSAPGELTVTWEAAKVDGSPVEAYFVTWPGGAAEVTSLSTVLSGLDNLVETPVSIKARNAAGWGPPARVTGHSAGPPEAPTNVALDPTEILDGAQQTVRVTWAGVSPNGPGPTTYTVVRTGGGRTVTVCSGVTETACLAEAVDNDGTTYAYAVTAANPHFTSPASASVSQVAVGRPGDFTTVTATATGASRTVRLRFTSPAAHDSRLTIRCTVAGTSCGEWNAPTRPTAYDEIVEVPANGEQPTLVLTATNTGATASTASVQSDTVHGPLTGTALSGLHAEGPYLVFGAAVDPQGLPADVTIEISNGRRVVRTITDRTGSGAWATEHRVKLGYENAYTVRLVATRGRDTQSDTGSTSTGTGAVSGEGTPGTAVDTSLLTIHVRNLPFSATLTCTIDNLSAGGRTTTSVGTDGSGNADHQLPEAEFVAPKGTDYRITCDDDQSPNTPVTATWIAP